MRVSITDSFWAVIPSQSLGYSFIEDTRVNVNVNVNLYSASSQKAHLIRSMCRLPSTDQKDTSPVYDENSQFACPAHANCFGTYVPCVGPATAGPSGD